MKVKLLINSASDKKAKSKEEFWQMGRRVRAEYSESDLKMGCRYTLANSLKH